MPLSSRQLVEHLRSADVVLDLGARAQVPLAASAWVGEAAAALSRGFLLLFDYGREAHQLHSAFPGGTLTTYRGHRSAAGDWLTDPGERDLTAHVDLTAVRRTAEAGGLETLGILDQTYFLSVAGPCRAARDRT